MTRSYSKLRPNTDIILRTPLIRSDCSNGSTLWLKNEAAQPSGSFKIRGPSNFLNTVPLPSQVVVAASTGNHAIGLSMAAAIRGYKAQIFLPETTPEAKKMAIQAAGGTINTVKGDYESALSTAIRFSEETGAVLVPSYDHDAIITGNEGIFDEICEELGSKSYSLFVPIGGGGILSAAIRSFAGRTTSIFGVELKPFDRVDKIVWKGATEIKVNNPPLIPSIEGVAIRTLGQIPVEIIRNAADTSFLKVTTNELIEASQWLWKRHGVRAELGGCTALAGYRQLAQTGVYTENAVCIVSGGNIDPSFHLEVLNKR